MLGGIWRTLVVRGLGDDPVLARGTQRVTLARPAHLRCGTGVPVRRHVGAHGQALASTRCIS